MKEATWYSSESGTSGWECVKSWWYECSRLSYLLEKVLQSGVTHSSNADTHIHTLPFRRPLSLQEAADGQIGPYSRPRLALNLWLWIPFEFPIKRRIGPWGMSCRRRVCGAGGWWNADPPHLSQNPLRMRRSRGCKLRPGFCSADRIRRDS